MLLRTMLFRIAMLAGVSVVAALAGANGASAAVAAWSAAPAYSGTGCPAASLAAFAVPDVLKMNFASFIAGSGETKSCAVRAPLRLRKGNYVARVALKITCDYANSGAGMAKLAFSSMSFFGTALPSKVWSATGPGSACSTTIVKDVPINMACAGGSWTSGQLQYRGTIQAATANFVAVSQLDASVTPVAVVSLCP